MKDIRVHQGKRLLLWSYDLLPYNMRNASLCASGTRAELSNFFSMIKANRRPKKRKVRNNNSEEKLNLDIFWVSLFCQNTLVQFTKWSRGTSKKMTLNSCTVIYGNEWRHEGHTLDMKVIHCTIKTNGCHDSHKSMTWYSKFLFLLLLLLNKMMVMETSFNIVVASRIRWGAVPSVGWADRLLQLFNSELWFRVACSTKAKLVSVDTCADKFFVWGISWGFALLCCVNIHPNIFSGKSHNWVACSIIISWWTV